MKTLRKKVRKKNRRLKDKRRKKTLKRKHMVGGGKVSIDLGEGNKEYISCDNPYCFANHKEEGETRGIISFSEEAKGLGEGETQLEVKYQESWSRWMVGAGGGSGTPKYFYCKKFNQDESGFFISRPKEQKEDAFGVRPFYIEVTPEASKTDKGIAYLMDTINYYAKLIPREAKQNCLENGPEFVDYLNSRGSFVTLTVDGGLLFPGDGNKFLKALEVFYGPHGADLGELDDKISYELYKLLKGGSSDLRDKLLKLSKVKSDFIDSVNANLLEVAKNTNRPLAWEITESAGTKPLCIKLLAEAMPVTIQQERIEGKGNGAKFVAFPKEEKKSLTFPPFKMHPYLYGEFRSFYSELLEGLVGIDCCFVTSGASVKLYKLKKKYESSGKDNPYSKDYYQMSDVSTMEEIVAEATPAEKALSNSDIYETVYDGHLTDCGVGDGADNLAKAETQKELIRLIATFGDKTMTKSQFLLLNGSTLSGFDSAEDAVKHGSFFEESSKVEYPEQKYKELQEYWDKKNESNGDLYFCPVCSKEGSLRPETKIEMISEPWKCTNKGCTDLKEGSSECLNKLIKAMGPETGGPEGLSELADIVNAGTGEARVNTLLASQADANQAINEARKAQIEAERSMTKNWQTESEGKIKKCTDKNEAIAKVIEEAGDVLDESFLREIERIKEEKENITEKINGLPKRPEPPFFSQGKTDEKVALEALRVNKSNPLDTAIAAKQEKMNVRKELMELFK